MEIEALELPFGDRWFVSTQELHSLIGKWSQPRWESGCVQAVGMQIQGQDKEFQDLLNDVHCEEISSIDLGGNKAPFSGLLHFKM